MNSLIGIWMYASLIYQGQPIPRPNEALKMYFTFENNYTNEIFYYRENERGFCRRKANYKLENGMLHQTITSVDENNADFCSQDSDMQMGASSTVKYEVIDGKFHLYLPLGEETLIYVWEKIDQM